MQPIRCCKDSSDEQTAIGGAQPEVCLQVFHPLFIAAITTDGRRSGDAGGGGECARKQQWHVGPGADSIS